LSIQAVHLQKSLKGAGSYGAFEKVIPRVAPEDHRLFTALSTWRRVLRQSEFRNCTAPHPRRITDLAGYMFDARKPRFVRALSLFHVVVPVVLIWMLHELGYDSRAPVAQTLLAWFVLPITYAVTTSSDENINWVRGPGKLQRRVHPLVWLGFLMLAFPIGLYLPMHFVLQALFAQAG
jgi:hypothetical protein